MVKIYKLVLLILLFGFLPMFARAATLSFSPSPDSYDVGSTFSVNVYVGSPDQAMNAASGIVSFPWSKLEVVSLSKTGSIFSLWAQEPSFSNSAGTVSFEGIVLNPGFTGTNGKMLTITFRTKVAGQANLSFSSGSVLANDGSGTNILTGMGVSVINIGQAIPPPAPLEDNAANNAPIITSSTHPDQAKWYTDNSPEFSWILPEGALEVRTSINTSPSSVPTIRYAPAISDKKIDNLADGAYYFHLQIRTSSGWGTVAHYRVNIDKTPPKAFAVTFPHGATSLEPQPVMLFNTTDDASGISRYDIKIGNGGPLKVSPPAVSNPYPLPPQLPGKHTVVVTAFDRAGNTTTSSADFTIEGIEVPIITYYPENITSGDLIKIRGTTYPDSDITILFKQNKTIISEEHTRSNSSGDFSFIVSKNLENGSYTFTTRVTDGRGAKSDETKPLTIVVGSNFPNEFMAFILNYLSLAILIILVLGGLIGTGLYIWHRLVKASHRYRKERKQAEQVLEKSFRLLRGDIDKHISRLRKVKAERELTREEIIFLERFADDLREAEDIIAQEIKDSSKKS